MNLYAFGKLPVEMGGRVQPIDTLARNSLRMISLRERYLDENGEYQPAVKWLLDLTARPDVADNLNIFASTVPTCSTCSASRGGNIIATRGMKSTKDKAKISTRPAPRSKGARPRSTPSTKRNWPSWTVACPSSNCCNTPSCTGRFRNFRRRSSSKPIRKPPIQSLAQIKQRLERLPEFQQTLAAQHPPLAVPPIADFQNEPAPTQTGGAWQPYSVAWMIKYLDEIRRIRRSIRPRPPGKPSSMPTPQVTPEHSIARCAATRSCWKISRRRK